MHGTSCITTKDDFDVSGLIAARTRRPFNVDMSLNLSAVPTLVEYSEASGVQYAFVSGPCAARLLLSHDHLYWSKVCGTTGEYLKLSVEERMAVAIAGAWISMKSRSTRSVHVVKVGAAAVRLAQSERWRLQYGPALHTTRGTYGQDNSKVKSKQTCAQHMSRQACNCNA